MFLRSRDHLQPFEIKLFFSRSFYNEQAKIKREFISSILQSTVTKREAKDYLQKYDLKDSKNKIALLILQDPLSLNQHQVALKKTLQKLINLGVSPVLYLQQDKTKNKDLNLLEHYRISDLLNCTAVPELDYIPESYKPRLYNSKGQRMLLYATKRATKNDDNDDDTSFVNFVKTLHTKLGSLEKVIILNKNGGIPTKLRNWYPHVYMNLRDEYAVSVKELTEKISSLNPERKTDFQEIQKLKQDIDNLKLFKDCLQDLPLTSTGMVTSYKSLNDDVSTSNNTNINNNDSSSNSNNIFSITNNNNPIIHNVLTDRSLVSCSLPVLKNMQLGNEGHEKWYESVDLYAENYNDGDIGGIEKDDMGKHEQYSQNTFDDISFQTTVLKKGININFFKERLLTENNSIGLPEKFHIHEKRDDLKKSKFKLDLNKICSIIKSSFNRDLDLEHYLNRINGNIALIIIIGDYEGIAICTYEGYKDSKNNKKELTYLDKLAVLPHLKGSLSIADLMFIEMFNQNDHLVWRSRKENVVNKWYFQRSKGSIDLDKIDPNDKDKDSIFRLFYHYGDEGKDIFKGSDVEEIKTICRNIRDIKPSWKK
ncbi:hypothetical protein ACO0SA_003006 [Hanseniaspora valbyensis]